MNDNISAKVTGYLEELATDIGRICDNIHLASSLVNDISFTCTDPKIDGQFRLVASLLDTVYQSMQLLDEKAIECVDSALEMQKGGTGHEN